MTAQGSKPSSERQPNSESTGSASSFETAGERLCGHALKPRDDGKYVPGQVRAEVIANDLLVTLKLTFVNNDGWAVCHPVRKWANGDFEPFPMFRVANQSVISRPTPIGRKFSFTDEQLEAMEKVLLD